MCNFDSKLILSEFIDSESEAPEVPVIPIELVERIVKDSLVLIDVREFKEVAEYGKIPTANVLPG